MGPEDALVLGNWVEPEFLYGETFDTVLVDYLIGALDRFAPYFQSRIFSRLRPHLKDRVYIIGLEPYPERAQGNGGKLIARLVALRDATLLLSQDRPNREYPRWWVIEQMESAGFRVLGVDVFQNYQGSRFIQAELDVVRSRLEHLPSDLRASIDAAERQLRKELLSAVASEPIAWGQDYVIAATVSQD